MRPNWAFIAVTMFVALFWIGAVLTTCHIVSGSTPCIEDRLAHIEARIDNVTALVLEQPVQVESRYTASHLMWILAQELEAQGVEVAVHINGETP